MRVRGLGALGIAAVLLLTASACGRDTASSLASPSPTERPVLLSTPWRLLRQEDKTLVVEAAAGGCIDFNHMTADENADEVVLTALSREITTTPTGKKVDACTGELSFHVAAACLEAPLGDRELKHAPVSPRGPTESSLEEQWPTYGDEQPEPQEPCPE